MTPDFIMFANTIGLLILASVNAILADVSHLPEVKSFGYKYPTPLSTSYGVPQAQFISSNNLAGGIYSGSTRNTVRTASNGGYNYEQPLPLTHKSTSFAQANSFHLSSSSSVNSQHNYPTVKQHVYYFTDPEPILVPSTRVLYHQHQPVRNDHHIFIKVNSAEFPDTPVLQPPAQNAQQTHIYVLSKTPEVKGDIEVPAPAPTQPPKPKVYFIKYKTIKDAEDTIKQIQDGGSADSISVSAHPHHTDQDFVHSIAESENARRTQEQQTANIQYLTPSVELQKFGLNGNQHLGAINVASSNVESGNASQETLLTTHQQSSVPHQVYGVPQ